MAEPSLPTFENTDTDTTLEPLASMIPSDYTLLQGNREALYEALAPWQAVIGVNTIWKGVGKKDYVFVSFLSYHVDSHQAFVTFTIVNGASIHWTAPLAWFQETITVDGVERRRFEPAAEIPNFVYQN